MSELKFAEFIVRMKSNPNEFWCLTSVATKMYGTNEAQIIPINKSIPYSKLKDLIFESSGMFSGGFYCGSVSAFFENENDINLLRIKNPDLLE